MAAYKPIEQRVFDNSIPEPMSGCWLWLGSVCKDGYSKTTKPYHTGHRMAYVAFKGPVPEGCEIDHLCRVRSCVNPDHLDAVPHAVNVGRGDYTRNHRNGRKTHCINGHEFNEENTTTEIWLGKPRRKCRTCANKNQNKRYHGITITEITK